MARNYLRPGLSKDDIDLVLAGKCIMINPDEKDVERAVQQVEKRCRKNKLPLEEARRVWSEVTNGNVYAAFAGEWRCPGRSLYEMQGTVFEMVRITDDLTGLICERQTILPGTNSRVPISTSENWKQVYPARWLNQVMENFWILLSDDELDELEKDMALKLMESRAADRDLTARIKQCIAEERKQILETLSRGVKPGFVSEFESACLDIASQLQSSGAESISWKDFKKAYPSTATRYQPELLELLVEGRIHQKDLQKTRNKSPYSIALSFWNGAQRMFDATQLVFSVRNSAIHGDFQERGGNYGRLSRILKKFAARDFHPGTASTIGWLRVHIDDENKLCFIDEVQSDTLEVIYEEKEEAAKEFMRSCADWHFHGFTSIYRWASDIGYRIGIHSKETAASKEGMTPSDRKWNTYYNPLIKRFKLVKTHVDGYPCEIWTNGQ